MQAVTRSVTHRWASAIVPAALLALGLSAAQSSVALEVGQPAPAINVVGVQGPVSLADAKGKVVYLDFWASWCGPCKQSFPWMADMQRKYGARGFQVLAVNLDAKRGDAERFLAETPAAFTVGFDAAGETPKRFAIKGMPSSVLIGADGTVIKEHAGFRDEDRASLEASIVDALKRAGR